MRKGSNVNEKKWRNSHKSKFQNWELKKKLEVLEEETKKTITRIIMSFLASIPSQNSGSAGSLWMAADTLARRKTGGHLNAGEINRSFSSAGNKALIAVGEVIARPLVQQGARAEAAVDV